MATFTPLGHFKQVACPEGRQCRLFHCLFSHAHDQDDSATTTTTPVEAPPDWLLMASRSNTPLVPAMKQKKQQQTTANDAKATAEPPAKRRRVISEVPSPNASSTETPSMRPPATATAAIARPDVKTRQPTLHSLQKPINPPARPRTLLQHSQPPLNSPTETPEPAPAAGPAAPTATAPQRRVIKKESLNPRHIGHIGKPPASHSSRMAILKKLHETLVGQNKKVIAAYKDKPAKRKLIMAEHEVVGMALDEEERIARENATLYNNVVRMRILKLMKMSREEWEGEVVKYLRLNAAPTSTTTATTTTTTTTTTTATSSTVKKIDTGLPPSLERLILPKLLSPLPDLARRSYTLTKPTLTAIAEAQHTATLAQNFEKCERCGTRFQVFPGRRATDGALATNGPCRYHPLKAWTPRAGPADHIVGAKQPVHGCCGEGAGVSAGCEKREYHVWKTVSADRLAGVLQFEETPEPSSTQGEGGKEKEYVPLTFDCEMSYTTLGLELVRMTAATWPEATPLIDVLVRPYGEILDWNTRYSGVDANLFAKAYPYDKPPPTTTTITTTSSTTPSLPLVPTPAAARSLLFTHLTPRTPLIGHGLENDLNACRIIHRCVIDTAVLFPHPRAYAFALRTLALQYLGKKIQSGGGTQGSEGHDSFEDAVVSGELVRWKVREVWRAMREDGWRVEGGKMVKKGKDKGEKGGKRKARELG